MAVSEWVEALSFPWPSGDYIPHEPSVPQDAFLWLQCIEAMYGGAAGGGKLLKLDTPIPTPSGWTTMGALKRGDELFDENGRVCRVIQAHRIDPSPESYRVWFDDGSHIDACADHRWLTYDAKELHQLTVRTPEWRAARRERRPSRATGSRGALVTQLVTTRNQLQKPKCLEAPNGSIRTTAEISATLETPRGRRNHAIPVTSALKLDDADLLVEPYLLGVWLGDGTSAAGSITTADPEIVQAFRDGGYEIRRQSGPYAWGTVGLAPRLGSLGLLRNKQVPPEYLRGSYEQRLSLLQGLMDSDGTCGESGSVTFGNMNRGLVESVAELARSLGSKCSVNTRLAKLKGRSCGVAWLVKWSPDYPAFRLKRKLDRQPLERRRTTKFHYIVGCERIKSTPMRCITVSSVSGLFLAGESMVPTHNSDALLMSALQYVDVPGYAALLMRKTYTELMLEGALLDRAKKWLGRTDAAWNGDTMRFTFPSGATVSFGYLAKSADRERYQSSEFQMIGMDEVTKWDETDYRFMFSRLRKPPTCADHPAALAELSVDGTGLVCVKCGNAAPPLSAVPLRMRSATNPGGRGHKFVKERFIEPFQKGEHNPKRAFIPAKLADNKHVDQVSYREALAMLEPELVEQLLEGNWDVREPGEWMMKDQRWIEAAVELGSKMWKEHKDGTKRLPVPLSITNAGTLPGLTNCIDWGEHTQSYVIWPLENGGIFVPPSEVVKLSTDPVETTKAILEVAMGFEHPLVATNYDAAGIQNQRTYLGVVRKLKRYSDLRSTGIPFNKYKREGIGYIRTLARRTFQGESERVLAIHPDNEELIRQLLWWKRKVTAVGQDTDEAVKVDDHGPDALIAGIALTSRKFRQYIEEALLDAYGTDEVYEEGEEYGS